MEDYNSSKSSLSCADGKAIGASASAYDAAKYMSERWPQDQGGTELTSFKAILLKCLAGECSAAVARVAFVEAAKEARIFLETTPRPVATGKLQHWHRAKTRIAKR